MSRRIALVILLCSLEVGCGTSSHSDAGFPDASSAPDAGGSAPDAGQPGDAGASDAGELSDSGAAPDGGAIPPDGGFAGLDGNCPVPPAHVDGPFATGPAPASANFLLTDTASEAVFRLDITGHVRDRWSVPVRAPFGVTHDKRNPDGFFVNGTFRSVNRGDLYRLSFTGAITATIAQVAINGQIWGMDFILGSDPTKDMVGLETVNTNSINVIMGRLIRDGTRTFEGGLFQPSSARWYGFYVERFVCDDAATIIYWTTRDGTILELRDWGVNAPLRSYPIPGTTGARGLTRTPRGDFYVVDAQNRRVLHLTPQLNIIDSFPTPGPSPADISYAE